MHEACVVLVMKINLSRYVQAFCNILQTVRPNRSNYFLELLCSSVLTMHGLNGINLFGFQCGLFKTSHVYHAFKIS